MSVAEEVYTKTKARSLAGMRDLTSHGYSSCAKHLGCVRSPLISVALDQIVLDELHLLLSYGCADQEPHLVYGRQRPQK